MSDGITDSYRLNRAAELTELQSKLAQARQQIADLEDVLRRANAEIEHQKANWSEMHRDCMKAEQQLAEARAQLTLLSQYKKAVDIGFTAAVLAMNHKFGRPKLSLREALANIQVTFRNAEMEFQNAIRATAIERAAEAQKP